MIWLLIGYLVVGGLFALLAVAWRERRFLMRALPPTAWGWLSSAIAVGLVVAAAWPLYAWVTWRRNGGLGGSEAPPASLGPAAPRDDPEAS